MFLTTWRFTIIQGCFLSSICRHASLFLHKISNIGEILNLKIEHHHCLAWGKKISDMKCFFLMSDQILVLMGKRLWEAYIPIYMRQVLFTVLLYRKKKKKWGGGINVGCKSVCLHWQDPRWRMRDFKYTPERRFSN